MLLLLEHFFLITNKKKTRHSVFETFLSLSLIRCVWFCFCRLKVIGLCCTIYSYIQKFQGMHFPPIHNYFIISFSLSLSLPTIWMALALLYWSWNNEKNNNDKTTTFAWCLFQLERNKQCKHTFVHVIHLDVDVKFKAEVNVTSELLLIEIFMIFFFLLAFLYI